MEFEAKAAIPLEQAEAVAPTPQDIKHPLSGTLDELGRIIATSIQLADTLNESGEELTTEELSEIISGLQDITTHSSRTAWQVALYAIGKNLMTQTKIATLLDTSKMTVSRRYHKDNLTESEEV